MNATTLGLLLFFFDDVLLVAFLLWRWAHQAH